MIYSPLILYSENGSRGIMNWCHAMLQGSTCPHALYVLACFVGPGRLDWVVGSTGGRSVIHAYACRHTKNLHEFARSSCCCRCSRAKDRELPVAIAEWAWGFWLGGRTRTRKARSMQIASKLRERGSSSTMIPSTRLLESLECTTHVPSLLFVSEGGTPRLPQYPEGSSKPHPSYTHTRLRQIARGLSAIRNYPRLRA